MKRSEYERARRIFWAQCNRLRNPLEVPTSMIARDVHAAEDAGVAWDPEEEPAKRLLCIETGAPRGRAEIFVEDSDGRVRSLTVAEAKLAVDLYNRRETIGYLANDLRRLKPYAGQIHTGNLDRVHGDGISGFLRDHLEGIATSLEAILNLNH